MLKLHSVLNSDSVQRVQINIITPGAWLAALAGRAGGGLPLGPHHLQLPQLLHLHAEVQIHQVSIINKKSIGVRPLCAMYDRPHFLLQKYEVLFFM